MIRDELLKTEDIRVDSSDVILLSEDQIGEALAKIRTQVQQIKSEDELKSLQKLREDLNNRLNQFLSQDLIALDGHPEVGKITDSLTQLTLGLNVEVKKIRTVQSAIKSGTKILGYADRLLKIIEQIRI
jgi:hypothetical protein